VTVVGRSEPSRVEMMIETTWLRGDTTIKGLVEKAWVGVRDPVTPVSATATKEVPVGQAVNGEATVPWYPKEVSTKLLTAR